MRGSEASAPSAGSKEPTHLVAESSLVHNRQRFLTLIPEHFPVHRAYYQADVDAFSQQDGSLVLGALADRSEFAVELAQREVWLATLPNRDDQSLRADELEYSAAQDLGSQTKLVSYDNCLSVVK